MEHDLGERIVATDHMEIDAAFLARLFLGGQSEHEQRLLAIRLLRLDSRLRDAVAAMLEPFEMFDLDLLTEYDLVLRKRTRAEISVRVNLDLERERILSRAFVRTDLEQMLRHFTYSDLLRLGEVTRRLFSWSMAEMLLGRSRRVDVNQYESSTSLQLALMVIDVVEILGVVGHSPEFPDVIRDVRRRIVEAAKAMAPAEDLCEP